MSIKHPGPLRAKVEEVLNVIGMLPRYLIEPARPPVLPELPAFQKLSLQCASVHCEDGAETAGGFCAECNEGMKFQSLRQVREECGLMSSADTGTLSVDHQAAILFARENRAEIIKAAEAEAARAEGLCSPCQLEIVSRVGGLDFEQNLALMEARYDR